MMEVRDVRTHQWLIGILGCLILVVTPLPFLFWRKRHIPTEPFPIHTVTWQEVGTICGVVDLNADGNDELLVQDKSGRWWWVQWGEKKQQRELLPVPAKAKPFWFQEAWQDRRPEVLIFMSGNQSVVITRSHNGWGKHVAKQVLKPTKTALTDLDSDGHLNDALLVDGRHLLWLKRSRDGTLYRKDRLTLPNPFVKVDAYQTDGWWRCWVSRRHFTLEGERLKWLTGDKVYFYWTKADIDGDGQIDRVEWWETLRFKRLKKVGVVEETEVQVWLSKVHQPSSFTVPMTMAFLRPPLVCDLDGDGKAEIVAMVPDQSKFIQRLTCWRYDPLKKRWSQQSTQPMRVKSASFGWERGFMVEEFDWTRGFKIGEFQKGKKVSLLMLVDEPRGVTVWQWRLEQDGWQGERLGNVFGHVLEVFDTEQNLFMWTLDTRPKWFWRMLGMLERWTKLNFRPPERIRLWAYREGKGFQPLITFLSKHWDCASNSTFDLNGDGRQEFIWKGFRPLAIHIGDYQGEKLRLGKFPLPSMDWQGRGQIRKGRKGWLIYQHLTTHRCCAVTVR